MGSEMCIRDSDNPFLEPELYIEEADDKANRYLSRRREVEIDKAL